MTERERYKKLQKEHAGFAEVLLAASKTPSFGTAYNDIIVLTMQASVHAQLSVAYAELEKGLPHVSTI